MDLEGRHRSRLIIIRKSAAGCLKRSWIKNSWRLGHTEQLFKCDASISLTLWVRVKCRLGKSFLAIWTNRTSKIRFTVVIDLTTRRFTARIPDAPRASNQRCRESTPISSSWQWARFVFRSTIRNFGETSTLTRRSKWLKRCRPSFIFSCLKATWFRRVSHLKRMWVHFEQLIIHKESLQTTLFVSRTLLLLVVVEPEIISDVECVANSKCDCSRRVI